MTREQLMTMKQSRGRLNDKKAVELVKAWLDHSKKPDAIMDDDLNVYSIEEREIRGKREYSIKLMLEMTEEKDVYWRCGFVTYEDGRLVATCY